MLETQKNPIKNSVNGKSIGSLLIGIVSIIGIFLVGNGTILSVVGLLLGIIAFIEKNKFKQKGIIFSVAGIIFNCLGIFSMYFN